MLAKHIRGPGHCFSSCIGCIQPACMHYMRCIYRADAADRENYACVQYINRAENLTLSEGQVRPPTVESEKPEARMGTHGGGASPTWCNDFRIKFGVRHPLSLDRHLFAHEQLLKHDAARTWTTVARHHCFGNSTRMVAA